MVLRAGDDFLGVDLVVFAGHGVLPGLRIRFKGLTDMSGALDRANAYGT